MVNIIFFIGLYLIRFIMALVAGYIGYIWGLGIDNAIYITLGYFLLLMFINVEGYGSSYTYVLYGIYTSTLSALVLSYLFLSFFFGLYDAAGAIPSNR
ncbi:hypothetical protein [Shewanella ulleungensis]|uniref:hypothetical protein n=1 Tax=Shewanella ulleungensis TaxID=2282699 RepID=UPI003D7B2341